MSDARPPGIRIQRPYSTEDEFVRGDGLAIGRLGMILLGAPERPIGGSIRFEIVLSSGEPVFRGEGRIIAYRSHNNGRDGLEVRFTRLDSRSKAIIDRVLNMRRSGTLIPAMTLAPPPTRPSFEAPPPSSLTTDDVTIVTDTEVASVESSKTPNDDSSSAPDSAVLSTTIVSILGVPAPSAEIIESQRPTHNTEPPVSKSGIDDETTIVQPMSQAPTSIARRILADRLAEPSRLPWPAAQSKPASQPATKPASQSATKPASQPAPEPTLAVDVRQGIAGHVFECDVAEALARLRSRSGAWVCPAGVDEALCRLRGMARAERC